MKTNNKRNIVWNLIGSTFSSFSSLFFLIAVTRINGVNEAGIFNIGFSVACLFFTVGCYSGRVFQVTDTNKKTDDSAYFYSKIITALLMLVISFIYCFAKDYSMHKSIILISLTVYKMCEAFADGMYAIIQKEDELYKVGRSLFVKAIIGISLFILTDYLTKSMFAAIMMLNLVNILGIFIYDKKNLKLVKFKLNKFNKEKVFEVFKTGIYSFGFSFLTYYIINASKYAIDNNLSNELQTIFGIIAMPASVLLLFGQFVIHPVLNKLKNTINVNKKEFNNLTLQMINIILVFGLISLVLAYYLGIPVLNLLYGVDLTSYRSDLLVIIIGATIYEIAIILSTSLIVMRSTLSQLIMFIIDSIITLFISNILVKEYGVFGASVSYLTSVSILLLMYIIVYIYKLRKYK